VKKWQENCVARLEQEVNATVQSTAAGQRHLKKSGGLRTEGFTSQSTATCTMWVECKPQVIFCSIYPN